MSARICIVDYGMGNLRSVEKALEHVGATAKIANDAETIRAAEGLILPGVGAFPKAMEGIRALGLDELIEERRAAGVPILGICLGLQLLFDSTTRARRGGGARPVRRRGQRARRAGAEDPQADIGWSPVRWERQSAPRRGNRVRDPLLPGPLLRPQGGCGRAAWNRGLRCSFHLCGGARQRLRCPVPPGEVERGWPSPALQLRRHLRLRSGVILYPAIDIRGGKAVRLLQGDYARETT